MLRAYTSLFKAFGTWNENYGNFISREDFISGSTLFVFQLEPNYSQHGQYLSLMKTGNVNLEVQFQKDLTGNIFFIYFSINYQFIFNKENVNDFESFICNIIHLIYIYLQIQQVVLFTVKLEAILK